jgi:cytosolic iron-sulfur protein assembly protein CIAO1
MANAESSHVPNLNFLAELNTPTPSRTWQSAPHPHLPIVATATSDKTVSIHSLRDFRLLSTVSGGHKRSIRSVAWRDDGKKGESVLATGSFDSSVGIWKREDAYSNAEGGPPGSSLGDDYDISNEGFVGSESIKSEDPEDWQFAVLLTGHDSEVKCVAFSPSNPSLLATSSRDKSLWIWEAISEEDDYETIAVLTEHSGDVKCVAWHPEREVLASGSYDDTIRLWRDIEDEGDWGCIGCIEGHEGTVWGVAWEPRGKEDSHKELRLASCSDDLTVRIWKKTEPEKREERKTGALPSIIRPPSSTEVWQQYSMLPRMHSRSIYAIAWSRVTGMIVSCGGDGSIFVYREASGCEQKQESSVQGMDIDADQQNSTWQVIAQMDGAHGDYEINHVCWARRQDRDKQREDEEVILSTGDDGIVRAWTLPLGSIG